MRSSSGLRASLATAVAATFAFFTPASAFDFDLKGSLGEAGFTHYVSPVSNPLFNETPYITTEIRPMWMHQEVPGDFVTGGGDIDVIAVQIRIALSERLGFIATKDGWADIDWDGALESENGAANLAFGFKYAVVSDPDTNTLVTVGARYEAPSGGIKSSGIRLQGHGDGLLDFFVSAARTFEDVGVEANLGTQVALDQDADTSFLHWALHVDYNVLDRLFPLVELNGFTPIEDGNRTAVGVNDIDVVNLGSSNSDTVITIAPGLRVRLTDNIDFGTTFELPITSEEDIMDWRVTTDFVAHL